MSTREKLLQNIRALIRARRSEIDPRVLEKAQEAALRQMKGKAAALPADTVPYDKAAAHKAVELFIAAHPDQKDFRQKLLDHLQKSSH